jgi:hypothetical protein
MISGTAIRRIIFSVNCYIATILAMFIAFSLDLKSPGWAMTTVYLTSQPLSGVLRAKAAYRTIGTFIGGAAMVAIVPNLVDAPELTTLAIILWVALCVFVSLLDRTPRSYMFVLSGYTAALIGFPSVLARHGVRHCGVACRGDYIRCRLRRDCSQSHPSQKRAFGLRGKVDKRHGRCTPLDCRRHGPASNPAD